MQTNTDEAQLAAVKKSLEKGVFPPKIKIPINIRKADSNLESLKKEFKKAKQAFKITKENLVHLKLSGKSKKTLAKAKFAKELAKSKKIDLETQIKKLKLLA